MTIEHLARPLEIKSLGGDGIFFGYASVFGVKDKQNEIVAKGAFSRTLQKRRAAGNAPAMLWMHDPTSPVGVWLSLDEDDNGLSVQGRLALSTQKGREAYELMKIGALTGLSIGYRVLRSAIDTKKRARILSEVELFEISLVTFPANDEARVRAVKTPHATLPRKRTKPAQKKCKKRANEAMTRAVVGRLHQAARNLKQRRSR